MRDHTKKAIEFMIGFVISCSINLLIFSSLLFKGPILFVILLHFLLYSIAYIFNDYPKQSLLILTIWIFIALSYCFKNQFITVDSIVIFFQWAFSYIQGIQYTIPKFFDWTLLFLLFMISNFLLIYLLRHNKNPFILCSPGIFFVLQWFRYIDQALVYFNLYILGMFIYFTSQIFLQYQEEGISTNKNLRFFLYSRHIIYGIVFILFVLSAANLLPLKFAPISLEYVNDKFVQFFPQITNWRNETSSEESTFTFETTPYTPLNDRLGGSVKQDSRAVMLVKADKPLYLRGSVKNTYSSHNWYSTNKNFDLLDSSGHIPTTENHNITNERVSIEVYPINIKTTTVFSPFRSIEIVIDAKKVKYNSDFEMFIDRSFFQPLPDHYQITSEIPVIKEGLPGYLHDPEDFRDYLQLPETLPKRVKNLAHEISSLHKNDYHKMKALEHYLRKNYTYSLSVSTPPVDRDFVDFFLFDEKSGYCTYYATSLAVMGRSIGIPTRYVEGFILPSYRNADGLYEVTANNAHAWVEAYFNDLGWITFEPTPAYPSQYHEYQPTESISDEQPYQIATGVSDRELPGGYLQFKDRLLEDGYQTQDIHDENRFVVNKENNQRLWPITAAIIGLALLLRILYCRQRNKKVFVVSGQKEKAAVYYHCILHLFSYMKPLNPKSCTPSEALHYIIDVLPLDEYDDYLIMVFEKALYSEEWISEEDDRLMAYFLQDMENVVKSKLGHIRFFTAKYFHGNLYPINIRAI